MCACVHACVRACVKSILCSRLFLLSQICDVRINVYQFFDVVEKDSLGPCFALFTISEHTDAPAPPAHPTHTLSPSPFPTVILSLISRRHPRPPSPFTAPDRPPDPRLNPYRLQTLLPPMPATTYPFLPQPHLPLNRCRRLRTNAIHDACGAALRRRGRRGGPEVKLPASERLRNELEGRRLIQRAGVACLWV